ncbi:single-stranded DNA-binding protein [Solimonas marina]|uniref:Single-stranded DNA-binding protein n=1 Tax=Solimonas marina TaxID=2714601 RepID=A0A970B6M5_9GAMM|nr:single-stranded DNA-binding protein [Solimonas marina]NKF22973.1 hypothetical protein [Solimonas marina]
MLNIEVTRSYTKEVTKKSTGEHFSIPMIEAYVLLPGERYPVKIEVPVAKGAKPANPGDYVLGPGSFYVDQFGRLNVRQNLELLPATKAKAA